MELNQLSPAPGSRKSGRRLGRGHTRGKTCGRGHKGYKSRSGSSVPASFEGGQMPLQRRLPKVGFNCASALTHREVRLSEINSLVKSDDTKDLIIDLEYLRDRNIVLKSTKTVKVFLSGSISSSVKVKLPVTAGAKKAIEDAGGKCLEIEG